MTARHYSTITSLDALKALIEKLMADERKISFDLETGYLGPDRLKGALQIDWDLQFISGFSITNAANWARYVPLAHDFGTNLPEEKTWELMQPVLETLPVLAHNAKFEIRNLRSLDRKGRGPRIELNVSDDTGLQAYVLTSLGSARFPRRGLKFLTKEVFGYEQAEIATLYPGATKKALEALRFSVLDPADPKVVEYACDDVVWALKLDEQFLPAIKMSKERDFIYRLEMATLPVLCDMEDAGHEVDWDAMREAWAAGVPFEDEMKASAKSMLATMAGEDLSELNLASTLQMRTVLYEKIGLSTTRKTKKGELSTDAQALETLAREHPAVKKVLEVREVHNLTARMKKWLGQYTWDHDNRVHASFNQMVVDSGRFSANDPAIQQLPKDWRWSVFPKVDVWNDEHWAVVKARAICGKQFWDGNFRDFMTVAEGCYGLGFDYSQIELRALAGMSKEPSLLKAFNEGIDVHTMTAAMMLGLPLEEAKKSKNRSIGKTINFALIYGMGEQSLAERLAITLPEAERLFAQYFSAFTLVTDWIQAQKDHGVAYGYVETAFGRKVTIWEYQSDNRKLFGKGQRLSVNAPVQGTAADIMKCAMVRAVNALKARGWWMTHVRIINNIHDALIFEVNNEVDPTELRALLQEAVVWEVIAPNGTTFPKIVADWEMGHEWGSFAKWTDQTPVFEDGRWGLRETDSEPASEPVEVEPGSMVVELAANPDRAALLAFVQVLQDHPGHTTITLKMPQGTSDMVAYPTSLTVADQGLIALTLPGSRVYRIQELNPNSLTEGMDL